MQKSLICGLISLAAVVLCSCQSKNAPAGSQRVSFELLGLDVTTEDMAPRRVAADYMPTDAGMTDIWVIEGTQVLCHQTSTDADFGTPSVSLSYGQHSLTFIASGQQGQIVSNGVYTADNAKETFGSTLALNVSASTSQQAVVLNRLCYAVKWQSTDLVPTDAASLKVTITEHRASVGAGLAGGEVVAKDWSYADISSYQGKTISVTAYGFPEVNGTEENISTTVTFFDAGGSVVYQHTKQVPVLSNRMTKISGAMFGSSTGAAVSVHTDWQTAYEASL